MKNNVKKNINKKMNDIDTILFVDGLFDVLSLLFVVVIICFQIFYRLLKIIFESEITNFF